MHTLRALGETLSRFVWPGRCPGCGQLLFPDEAMMCACCAAETPLLGDISTSSPHLHWAWSRFRYNRILARAIPAWKYNGREATGRALARALAQGSDALLERAAPGDAEAPVALIPVPIHPAKRRRRGFDQVRYLASALGRRSERWVLRPRVLRRVVDTRAQATLERSERLTNLEGAFESVSAPRERYAVLVDDVMTTGATAVACVEAMRRGGMRFERVGLAVLAHSTGEGGGG